MQTAIQQARISCVDQTVFVGGVEKSCRNLYDCNGTAQIVCNAQRFTQTSESDQYVLVHHELAGLAGFEVTTATGSNYEISNQITSYQQDQVVKKLVVKSPSPSGHPGYIKVQDGQVFTALFQQLTSIAHFDCVGSFGKVSMTGTEWADALRQYGAFYRATDGSPTITNFAWDLPDYKVTFILTLDASLSIVNCIDHYTTARESEHFTTSRKQSEPVNKGSILAPQYTSAQDALTTDHSQCLAW